MNKQIKEALKYCYYYIYKTELQELVKSIQKKTVYRDRYNISKYKNMHRGERCFIVATGPSLQTEKLQLLNNEYTFTMNSGAFLIEKYNFRPKYYMTQDIDVYNKIKDRLDVLKRYNVKCFFGDTIPVSACSYADYFSLKLQKHLIGNPACKFSDDASECIFDGNTITYSVIQMAVYMGFTEIYLLGCDSDFSGKTKHIISYEENKDDVAVKGTENFAAVSGIAYMTAKEFGDSHGIKIINSTNGGKLEVFPRKNLDEVLGI